jgi:hypothetical protein
MVHYLRCDIGIHRSLGTHLTFVQSATIDKLKEAFIQQYQVLSKYFTISNMEGSF